MAVRVALIGVGCWGKHLARNLHQLGVLAAIGEHSSERRNEALKLYPDVRTTDAVGELLEDPSIDAVCIATPAVTHFHLALKALQAGKDLYVEKPLCMNVAEGEILAEVAERNGCVLMTGHLLQYHPYVSKLQSIVQSGELGELLYISAHRLDLGRFRFEENALWNFAPHDFSMILSLCDNMPTSVRCHGHKCLTDDVEDLTVVDLKFPGRLRAHVYVSWISPIKEQKLTVVGTKGMAVFDDTAPWETKLQLFRNHLEYRGEEPQLTKVKPEYVYVAPEEPLKSELQHFINCCDQRLACKTGPQESLRVLSLLESAQHSLVKGGTDVPLTQVALVSK